MWKYQKCTRKNLKTGGVTSCGCNYKNIKHNFKDLTNLRFGKIKVLNRDFSITKYVTYKCECDCGVIKNIRSGDLQRDYGSTTSCGCSTNVTHGLSRMPEYKIWKSMIERCGNLNFKSYKDYGGRGITVCDEWIKSFETFIKDMGLRPTPFHSIDRIDNNGNYEPGNCKWSTKVEQGRNMRSNVIKSVKQADEIRQKYQTGNYTYRNLAVEFNCSSSVIHSIINNKSWI